MTLPTSWVLVNRVLSPERLSTGLGCRLRITLNTNTDAIQAYGGYGFVKEVAATGEEFPL